VAQAGLHAILGIAVTRPLGDTSWCRAGILIGSMAPDLDILIVAIATLAGVGEAETTFHRTFSHSLLAVLLTAVVFWAFSKLLRRPCWAQLGVGLAIGMAMHIGLDLLLWFRPVWLTWPWLEKSDLWKGTPGWWIPWGRTFELPLEFGWFCLLFIALRFTEAGRRDRRFRMVLHWWASAQFALLIFYSGLAVLTRPAVNIMKVAYVAPYLVSLFAACFISLRAYTSNRDIRDRSTC
jgi:membrane-bound metal-dependent hydrolase YbcI (DUF457 family)